MYLEEDLFEKRTKQQRAKDGGRLLSKESGCVKQARVQYRKYRTFYLEGN